MAGKAARVLIVDDHAMVRDGLRSMLANDRSLEVVGEAISGADAVAAVARLAPDVVLMDIRMPGMDGLEATRQVKHAYPGVSVVMVTMYDEPDYLLEAIAAGAAGYVLKDASRFELLQAVRTAAQGGTLIHPDLMARSLQRLATRRHEPDRSAGPFVGLTAREMDVLRELAHGRSNKEIALHLGVSVATVKTHVEHVIQKLGVADRTQAAVLAATNGLLSAAAA